jgi:hypothetical protein
MVYNYLPLATSSQRLAVNFMHFYAKHGFEGMRAFYERVGDTRRGFSLLCEMLRNSEDGARKKLAEDSTWSRLYPNPDDALDFLFPASPFPIYLALHRGMLASIYWYEYGSWSPGKPGRKAVAAFFDDLSEEEGYAVEGDFRINLRRGGRFKIEVDGKPSSYQVSHILTHDGRSLEERKVAQGGLRFEWVPGLRFGALLTPNFADSVFNKLYLRHAPVPGLFEPLAIGSPSYQVWRVQRQRK